MNVLYSLIKMKARFFNIVIYLICCRCLVLHSVAAENSTVTTSTQASHVKKVETEIVESATIEASIPDSTTSKIIYVNQTIADRNNTIHTNQTLAKIKNSTISGISQDTTDPSKESKTTSNTEKTTKIGVKSMETIAPTAAASSPPLDGEGKPSSNGRKGGFDGPSFIGGIILALGLIGFGYIAYKFCSKRTNINYRNV